MKTLGRFVLVDNANKKQLYLQWKTQAFLNRTLQNNQPQPMTYTARKKLISGLTPISSGQNPLSNRNSIKKQFKTSASTNNLVPFVYANPQRQNYSQSKTETKTFHRTRSVGKLAKTQSFGPPKTQINIQKLKQTITKADKKKGKPICIFKMRRQGLRYKIKHCFFPITNQTKHEQFIKQVKQAMFQQFTSIPDKIVYLFHLSKQPIFNIVNNLNPKQYVIFADVLPKFDIPFEMQMKLFEQASIIQEQIKINSIHLEIIKKQYDVEEEKTIPQVKNQVYQWQKITNVKNYVDKLIDNPNMAKKSNRQNQTKDNLQMWYQQKYKLDQQKKGQKNPFFDVQCHFPNQTIQSDMLQQAAIKVDYLPTTINKHQIKQRSIQNMMEKIKRQMENAEKIKKQEDNRVKTIGYKSSKHFFKELDQKNTPLAFQNIPYIMQKYGVNRAEAYNLYNLYKSLQKVSAMRLFQNNQYRRVKQKGIDRKTFDEGLKGLQINPGDQVIRNICYFPQFITWQQFIKIISISMRKTPKSKLEAILEGLGSNAKGYLTGQQIGIMVGSSLQKIFGKDEPELRKYFVSVVMKELDKDKSGTIEIEELKEHVLNKGLENLDIVAYLMLNS